MWWTHCQQDLTAEIMLARLASTKPTHFSAPLFFLCYLGNSRYPSHTYESLLRYWERFSCLPSISACDHIFDHLEWQLDIPYLFILWLKLFPLWSLGTLLAPGPCVFWAVDKLSYFMEGTGRYFGLHLVYTSCPGPRLNSWHWRKTRNQCLKQQTWF